MDSKRKKFCLSKRVEEYHYIESESAESSCSEEDYDSIYKFFHQNALKKSRKLEIESQLKNELVNKRESFSKYLNITSNDENFNNIYSNSEEFSSADNIVSNPLESINKRLTLSKYGATQSIKNNVNKMNAINYSYTYQNNEDYQKRVMLYVESKKNKSFPALNYLDAQDSLPKDKSSSSKSIYSNRVTRSSKNELITNLDDSMIYKELKYNSPVKNTKSLINTSIYQNKSLIPSRHSKSLSIKEKARNKTFQNNYLSKNESDINSEIRPYENAKISEIFSENSTDDEDSSNDDKKSLIKSNYNDSEEATFERKKLSNKSFKNKSLLTKSQASKESIKEPKSLIDSKRSLRNSSLIKSSRFSKSFTEPSTDRLSKNNSSINSKYSEKFSKSKNKLGKSEINSSLFKKQSNSNLEDSSKISIDQSNNLNNSNVDLNNSIINSNVNSKKISRSRIDSKNYNDSSKKQSRNSFENLSSLNSLKNSEIISTDHLKISSNISTQMFSNASSFTKEESSKKSSINSDEFNKLKNEIKNSKIDSNSNFSTYSCDSVSNNLDEINGSALNDTNEQITVVENKICSEILSTNQTNENDSLDDSFKSAENINHEIPFKPSEINSNLEESNLSEKSFEENNSEKISFNDSKFKNKSLIKTKDIEESDDNFEESKTLFEENNKETIEDEKFSKISSDSSESLKEDSLEENERSKINGNETLNEDEKLNENERLEISNQSFSPNNSFDPSLNESIENHLNKTQDHVSLNCSEIKSDEDSVSVENEERVEFKIPKKPKFPKSTKKQEKKYYETFINQTPTIIFPQSEVEEDDEPKRRSSRIRVKPLEYWRNQKLKYKIDSQTKCFTIEGVEKGFKPENPFSKKIVKNLNSNKRKYKQINSKKSKAKDEESSESDEEEVESESEEETEVTKKVRYGLNEESIHQDLNESALVLSEKIKKEAAEFYSKQDLVWKPSRQSEGVFIALMNKTKSSKSGTQASGFIKIVSFTEKPRQLSANYVTKYVVMFGAVSVQIADKPTVFLKSMDCFTIEESTWYSIRNLRKDEALLYFDVCSVK